MSGQARGVDCEGARGAGGSWIEDRALGEARRAIGGQVTPPVMIPVPPSVPWVLGPPLTVTRPVPEPDPVVLFTSSVPAFTVVPPA